MELFLYIISGIFTVFRASIISVAGVYWKICIENLFNRINSLLQNMNATNGYTREIPNEKFLERFVCNVFCIIKRYSRVEHA